MKHFIWGRVKSIRYAFKGFFFLIRTEHAIISQLIISGIFTGLGFYLGITREEWVWQIVAIGLVLSTESLNTAIEKICDFIHPDYHPKIGIIKDVASGAVTFAALTALVIAAFIYLPYMI
ncbi:diacylglycerol kinase [Algoriphagus sp. AK58]|nr:diacylglycerol kinase [Algoriphagus sp. AK58]